jgi:hypothetical protein
MAWCVVRKKRNAHHSPRNTMSTLLQSLNTGMTAVVGINTRINGTNVGLAVPVYVVKTFLKSYETSYIRSQDE